MLKSTEKVETNRYALEIVIDGEDWKKAVADAERKGMKKINVPGFRKGHAPKNMIYRMYGEDIFLDDALNAVYGDAVESAIKESKLELAEQKADFEMVSLDKDAAVFKALVTTVPEVKLGDYKGLEAERPVVELSDDEIDAQIESLRDKEARIVSVEGRAAELGDIAVIDYEGFVDGVPFNGGKDEGHSLELGSGQFIPGFEEQVVGHNVDEEFDVNVTFPAEYHSEDLAGKEAVFKIKLHEIKKRELPEVDDEFAKDVSEFDTVADLKKDIGEKILQSKNANADAEVENQLITKASENAEMEIPACMIDERIAENVMDFEQRLAYQGLDIKTYLKYTGMDMDGFKETFRPVAEKQVRMRLTLEAIAKAEKVEVTDEEVEAKFKELAEQYKVEIDQVKAAIPEAHIKADLSSGKAIDIIKAAAVITDAKPEKKETKAKKAPAKKAPAKKATEKKTEEKKPAAKKAPAKKPAAKKTADKAETEKKAEPKKTTAKKPAAKKAPAKKPAAKKTEEKAE